MQIYLPESRDQFLQYLQKVHENKNHIKMIKVDSASSQIRVNLDFAAHVARYPDVYIPVKKNLIVQAKEVLAELLKESDAGHPPNLRLADRLYDCIDFTKI